MVNASAFCRRRSDNTKRWHVAVLPMPRASQIFVSSRSAPNVYAIPITPITIKWYFKTASMYAHRPALACPPTYMDM